MVNLSYNPFNKSLHDLTVSDLVQLRQVAEGWYIEYKSTIVPTRNIAKSLAAFANHYGGWLFYGIESSQDGDNLAASFPGLDQTQITTLIENIRNAAKDLLNPSPYYEYKLLNGPCPDIGLADHHSIVVVVVPSGANAPYIHGDGRIYRRIADSSDPRVETDRFILDQLWSRKRAAERALASLLRERPTISRTENDSAFMHVFLLQDPMKRENQITELSFDQFVDCLSQVDVIKEGYGVPFDNFYTMTDGLIARQVANNNPYHLLLTWKHFDDGSSLISVPLRTIALDVYGSVDEHWFVGYEQAEQFIHQLQQARYADGTIIDVHRIMVMIVFLVFKHKVLIERGKVATPTYAKIAFDNIWRSMPFFDTESYLQFIRTHGIPLVQEVDQYAPAGTTFGSLVRIEYSDDVQQNIPLSLSQVTQVSSILSQVGNALGIPSHVLFSDTGDWINAIYRTSDVVITNNQPME